MARLMTRVKKLETLTGAGQESPTAEYRRHTARMALAAFPEWKLVEECDTDPATYAYIEARRATARGDHQLARDLRAQYPLRRAPCPPEIANRPCGMAAWVSRGEGDPDKDERAAAIERAIAAALKRLGRRAGSEELSQEPAPARSKRSIRRTRRRSGGAGS